MLGSPVPYEHGFLHYATDNMKLRLRDHFVFLCLATNTLQAAPQLNIDTVATVGAIGNSICRNQYSPMKWSGPVGLNRQWTSFGAFIFFACGEIAIPDVYAFEGHSGKTSAEIDQLMLPKDATEPWGVDQTIPVGIAALRPDITIIISSTNDLLLAPQTDVVSGKALEDALKGLKKNIHYVSELGSIPVVCNLLPIEGLTPLVPGATIPNDLTKIVPIWNAAIERLCIEEDVWHCDIFAACAQNNGSPKWKDGYVYRKGSEVEFGSSNAWKVHPSLLASLAIARDAIHPRLQEIIGPQCPRISSTDTPNHSSPPAKAWKLDYDPQSNSSFERLPATNGGSSNTDILRFQKPTSERKGHAQWTSGGIEVTPGQRFLYAADLRFIVNDRFSSIGFSIVDFTKGSESRGLPLSRINISRDTAPKSVDTRTFRASGIFTVPENVTRICALVSINRIAGGTDGKNDVAIVKNLILIPWAPK